MWGILNTYLSIIRKQAWQVSCYGARLHLRAKKRLRRFVQRDPPFPPAENNVQWLLRAIALAEQMSLWVIDFTSLMLTPDSRILDYAHGPWTLPHAGLLFGLLCVCLLVLHLVSFKVKCPCRFSCLFCLNIYFFTL